jgi:hypothetical protein
MEFLNFPILRLSLQNPRIVLKKKNCNKRNGGYGNLWCRQHSLIGDSSRQACMMMPLGEPEGHCHCNKNSKSLLGCF